MNALATDAKAPDLGIWMAFEQAAGCSQAIISHFKILGVQIKSDELSLTTTFDL